MSTFSTCGNYFLFTLFIIIATILSSSVWSAPIEDYPDLETANSTLVSQTRPRGNNMVNQPGYYAYLYENLRLYFLRWYLPTIIIMGTLGTVFCLIFLFLSRLFPTNMLIWLVSICLGDFLILVTEGVWMFFKVWFRYDFRDENDVICLVHTAFSNYLLYWSAYMQSLLSLQRAFLVIRPLRARYSGPSGRAVLLQWTVVSILLIFPVLPHILYWRVVNGDCDPVDKRLYYFTTVCDFIFWGLVPLLAMTTATVVICWSVFQFGKNFKVTESTVPVVRRLLRRTTANVLGSTNSVAQPREVRKCGNSTGQGQQCRFKLHNSVTYSSLNSTSTDPFNYTCPISSMVNLNRSGAESPQTHQRQGQTPAGQRHGTTDNTGHVARLLIGMNIWYVVSTFPLLTYLIVLNFILPGIDPNIHRFMYYLNRSLCFLNSCSNWIFYCASGRLFRQKIAQIFCHLLRKLRFHSARKYPSIPVIAMTPNYNRTLPTKQMPPNQNGSTAKVWTSRRIRSSERVKQCDSSNKTESDIEVSFTQKSLRFLRYYSQCFCYCPGRKQIRFNNENPSEHQGNTDSLHRQQDDTASIQPDSLCDCNACFSRFCCLKVWCYGDLVTGWTTRNVDKANLCSFFTNSNSSSSSMPPPCFQSELVRSQSQLMKTVSDVIPAGRVPTVKNRKRRCKAGHREYNSAPASLGEVSSVSLVNTWASEQQSAPDGGSKEDQTKRIGAPLTNRPTCYCYISSQGGRRYQYNYCKIHQQSGQTRVPCPPSGGGTWVLRDLDQHGISHLVQFVDQPRQRCQCHCNHHREQRIPAATPAMDAKQVGWPCQATRRDGRQRPGSLTIDTFAKRHLPLQGTSYHGKGYF